MNKWGLVSLIFAIFLLSNLFISCNVKACKDIVACGDATEGDFNLLLKVRDPSRPGLQVLCIVPEGYEYTYRYPWNGKPLESKVTHKFIGVASKGDTIPNIVKAGMTLSDAGLSYGDADTDSNWVNPTRHAWDDFDWIRYACEKADDEDEAVDLLTKDAVKKMHATGVSENLFVVGPNKGVVIEADAFRYKVKEINDGVIVMSNYPKELWRTHIREKLPNGRSFNTVVEKYVQNREAVRLKSLFGIRIVEIGNNFISVKPVSFIHALKTKSLGVVTKINLGERVTVGYYSVELKHIDGNRAKVRVANNYKVWEEKMLDHIQPQYGHITVKKMINWSRLHKEDLDGLRPMCQNIYEYEAVAIYKIPEQNYEIMSSGWFSPNHACSSIYVPFHICNTDIYDPYETGEAAELCLNLLKEFGHGVLDTNFTRVEEVFLNEINDAEQISIEQMENDLSISDFLTIIDTGMQKQAFLTEEIWMEAIRVLNPYKKKAIMDTIATLWDTDYANTLDRMKNALLSLEEFYGVNIIKEKIVEIALDICKSRIDAANTLEKETQIAEEEYEEANKLIKQGKYNPGFDNLQKAFTRSDMLIKGKTFKNLDIVEAEKNKEDDPFLYVLIFVLIFAILALILRLRLNSQ